MKYIILFLTILICSCTNKHKKTSTQAPPDEIQEVTSVEIAEDEEMDKQGEGWHFVARFKFTTDRATLESAEKASGDFSLLIAPAFNAFIVVYQGEQLVSFHALPKPLEHNPTAPTATAYETVLLPSLVATHPPDDLKIGIYEVTAYIEDWTAAIGTKSQLEGSLKDGFLGELYVINPDELQADLRETSK